MKRNNIFVMMAASLLMLLGSCSEEMELDRSREDASSASYAVRFTLGGSAGEVLTRGGGEGSTITAEADEKTVAKLYAVVFKDLGNGAVTGQNARETNNETFYKVIDVLASGSEMESSKKYKFEVGEPGHYQIFFVANPSQQLKTAIEALKGDGQSPQAKTVSDFKKLQETTQDPETKPMLMTSIAYGATVDAAADVDLKVVELTRAESRIDLVNQAPGVKITKVVFKNRAKGTVLIADNSISTIQEEFKEASKEYLDVNLVGTSRAEYKAKIYSYEQYGTETNAPSMDIIYDIAGKSYTHTVDFKTAAFKSQQISLKRNTLYKVTLKNASGKLSLELTVADWDKGEEFTVSSQDLKDHVSNGPDYSTAALGDFMLKDGTLIKSSDKDFNAKKAQAIGVVALLYKDVNKGRIGAKVAEALKPNKVHGLVLALKNASTSVTWGPIDAAVGTTYDQLGTCYTSSHDGYADFQNIKGKGDNWSTTYPAFGAVQTFDANATKAPEMTSGWYLPSEGEWADIMDKTYGIGDCDISSVKSCKSYYVSIANVDTYISALNETMKTVGKGNYDAIVKGNWFWSSSEYSAAYAYNVVFTTDGYLYFNNDRNYSN